MKLNITTIRCIEDMAEHFKQQMEEPENIRQLEELERMCKDIPTRFTIEIKRVELVPETTDLILNYLVKEVLILLEADDGSDVELSTAIWQYLYTCYGFDPECHYILKYTTEEAFTYAFNELGIAK